LSDRAHGGPFGPIAGSAKSKVHWVMKPSLPEIVSWIVLVHAKGSDFNFIY
jgi:hypothetical protein